MFGGVLEARHIHERRAPNDRFQFVRFNKKGNLLRKALVHAPVDYRSDFRLSK